MTESVTTDKQSPSKQSPSGAFHTVGTGAPSDTRPVGDDDRAVIAVFGDLDGAQDAVERLAAAGFPVDRISIIGKDLQSQICVKRSGHHRRQRRPVGRHWSVGRRDVRASRWCRAAVRPRCRSAHRVGPAGRCRGRRGRGPRWRGRSGPRPADPERVRQHRRPASRRLPGSDRPDPPAERVTGRQAAFCSPSRAASSRATPEVAGPRPGPRNAADSCAVAADAVAADRTTATTTRSPP
jgi:hypothetical protein